MYTRILSRASDESQAPSRIGMNRAQKAKPGVPGKAAPSNSAAVPSPPSPTPTADAAAPTTSQSQSTATDDSSSTSIPASAPPATGAGAPAQATAASGPPSSAPEQPQFADDDPDSPYYDHQGLSKSQLLEQLDNLMMDEFTRKHWSRDYISIPAAPQTAAEAALLQSQIDQLLEEGGRLYEAAPWQCQIAMYCVWVLGPDHTDTLQAVYRTLENAHQRFEPCAALTEWLLPRAARQWGLGHPHTRQLVEWAAQVLHESADIREHPTLTQTARNIAAHLPGGLGWGTASLAPVPDEEAFNKHVVLQERAKGLMFEAQYKLAKAMLERCLAYYVTLGPHWLASPRKARCREFIGLCEAKMTRDIAAAEPYMLEAKRTAQKELGPTHRCTLLAIWQVCARSIRHTNEHTHTNVHAIQAPYAPCCVMMVFACIHACMCTHIDLCCNQVGTSVGIVVAFISQ